MRYGLPYQGSKNRLAKRIVDLLPSADNLYDVFAGGCAISHCALLSGKYKCVHFSDINGSVVLFKDCLEGNIPDGSEWISREEFERRKDTDPYVRILWSFGNNQKSYLYSQDIEPYKKAVHEMIYAPTPNERRLKFREVCRLMPLVKPSNPTYNLEHSERIENTPPYLSTYNTQSHSNVHGKYSGGQTGYNLTMRAYRTSELGGAERLQHQVRAEAFSQIPFLNGEYRMQVCDYRDVQILPNSVIYCDIPYLNTGTYRNMKFDFDAFYQWALQQEQLVFISEYYMPDDFVCIAEFKRTSSFSATNNSKKEIEKVFIPKHQFEQYKSLNRTSLFD